MRDWIVGIVPGFWQWLDDASQSQATFLGTLTGSSIGLIALLIGALFNAHLNRRRDDRLRREDQRALANALRAELAELHRALVLHSKNLSKLEMSHFLMPDMAQSVRIMPDMVSKLGLLDPETIESVITAYSALEGYGELLLALTVEDFAKVTVLSSEGRHVLLPAEKAHDLISQNVVIVGKLQKAIASLDTYLRSRRRAWRWMRATG
jgi:hypothetical protein